MTTPVAGLSITPNTTAAVATENANGNAKAVRKNLRPRIRFDSSSASTNPISMLGITVSRTKPKVTSSVLPKPASVKRSA